MPLYVAVFDANGVLLNTKRMNERFQKGIEALFKSEKILIKMAALSKEWRSIAADMDFSNGSLQSAREELFQRMDIPMRLLAKYSEIDRDSLAYCDPSEPGLKENIQKIKRLGLYAVVLSDTVHSKSEMELMLSAAGLRGLFDAIIVPTDTGYTKPSREAYMAALEPFKADPESSIFVGHAAEEIRGAKLAGMLTFAYGKKVREADYNVKDFKELFETLRTMKKQGR
ncbi:HAD family hydrolase [Candidatus Marsarchaeota archaeon]|jgi:HAD superfamily hydrolase (TIGR01509 family)|nr:HAD family hydrolase [Candidatus Marsarchaeota archaeon]